MIVRRGSRSRGDFLRAGVRNTKSQLCFQAEWVYSIRLERSFSSLSGVVGSRHDGNTYI
jgi:hypothetical protein